MKTKYLRLISYERALYNFLIPNYYDEARAKHFVSTCGIVPENFTFIYEETVTPLNSFQVREYSNLEKDYFRFWYRAHLSYEKEYI